MQAPGRGPQRVSLARACHRAGATIMGALRGSFGRIYEALPRPGDGEHVAGAPSGCEATDREPGRLAASQSTRPTRGLAQLTRIVQ